MSYDDISTQPESMRPDGGFYTPQYRESYPIILLLAVGTVLSAIVLVACFSYRPLKPVWYIPEGATIGVVLLWWRGTQRTLRERRPPPDWRSQVIPRKLVYMSLEVFDTMRFELPEADEESATEPRVYWASRYSRVTLFWMRVLLVAACFCPVGAALWPKATFSIGDQLEKGHSLIWLWAMALVTLVAAASFLHYLWDYSRIMVDDAYFYDLRENPAWLPWLPGKNNPIPMELISRADPEDDGWGKFWGHGTVILTTIGYGASDTYRFRNVPRHRELCNVVNNRAKVLRAYSPML